MGVSAAFCVGAALFAGCGGADDFGGEEPGVVAQAVRGHTRSTASSAVDSASDPVAIAQMEANRLLIGQLNDALRTSRDAMALMSIRVKATWGTSSEMQAIRQVFLQQKASRTKFERLLESVNSAHKNIRNFCTSIAIAADVASGDASEQSDALGPVRHGQRSAAAKVLREIRNTDVRLLKKASALLGIEPPSAGDEAAMFDEVSPSPDLPPGPIDADRLLTPPREYEEDPELAEAYRAALEGLRDGLFDDLGASPIVPAVGLDPDVLGSVVLDDDAIERFGISGLPVELEELMLSPTDFQ